MEGRLCSCLAARGAFCGSLGGSGKGARQAGRQSTKEAAFLVVFFFVLFTILLFPLTLCCCRRLAILPWRFLLAQLLALTMGTDPLCLGSASRGLGDGWGGGGWQACVDRGVISVMGKESLPCCVQYNVLNECVLLCFCACCAVADGEAWWSRGERWWLGISGGMCL